MYRYNMLVHSWWCTHVGAHMQAHPCWHMHEGTPMLAHTLWNTHAGVHIMANACRLTRRHTFAWADMLGLSCTGNTYWHTHGACRCTRTWWRTHAGTHPCRYILLRQHKQYHHTEWSSTM